MDDRPVGMSQTAQLVQSPPRRQVEPADPFAMALFGVAVRVGWLSRLRQEIAHGRVRSRSIENLACPSRR
jgi:hypothetical protein